MEMEIEIEMEIQKRIKVLDEYIESKWIESRERFIKENMTINMSNTEKCNLLFDWFIKNNSKKQNFTLQKYREYLIIFKMQKKFRRNRYNPKCDYCIKLVYEKIDEFNEYIKNIT